MGVSGVFGLVNTSLIIRHFGADAFAQYGLLATFPTLMPFTDLGIGAVILNTVASSTDPAHDSTVRRTITTAIRVLLGSALVISTVGIVVMLLTAALGQGCIFSALSVGIFEGAIFLAAGAIEPIMTPAALQNLSYVGSILIFCVGTNLFGLPYIRVANFLPTLVIAVLWGAA